MSVKSIAKVWTFASSSSKKTYQTLLYTDFTTSCDCPGWTRRTDSNGKRTCRHVRLVELGSADAEAINFHAYDAPKKMMLHTGEVVKVQGCVVVDEPETKTIPVFQYGQRKLCL